MSIRHHCRFGANPVVVPADATECTDTCETIAPLGTFGADWDLDVSRYGVGYLAQRMTPNHPAFGVCRWNISTTGHNRTAGQHATGG